MVLNTRPEENAQIYGHLVFEKKRLSNGKNAQFTSPSGLNTST